MTQTTKIEPTQQAIPTHPAPIHPTDVLLNLIVHLLAPIFLDASGGNIAFARMAALETVNAYRAHNDADLIAVAQIIAFGLAALGSLSLSMADDISLSMTLRLRGNANALNRSAEQNRRAIRNSRTDDPAPRQADEAETPFDPVQEKCEAEVITNVAETQKLVAQTQSQARPQTAKPVAEQPSAPTSPPTLTDHQRHALWAAAMTNVARECTASLPNLPPAERKVASIRAAALSSCASQLLSGSPNLGPRQD